MRGHFSENEDRGSQSDYFETRVREEILGFIVFIVMAVAFLYVGIHSVQAKFLNAQIGMAVLWGGGCILAVAIGVWAVVCIVHALLDEITFGSDGAKIYLIKNGQLIGEIPFANIASIDRLDQEKVSGKSVIGEAFGGALGRQLGGPLVRVAGEAAANHFIKNFREGYRGKGLKIHLQQLGDSASRWPKHDLSNNTEIVVNFVPRMPWSEILQEFRRDHDLFLEANGLLPPPLFDPPVQEKSRRSSEAQPEEDNPFRFT